MGLKNIISGWVNNHQRKRDNENVERASTMLTDLLLELEKTSGKMLAVEDKSIYKIQEDDLNQYLITASVLESELQNTGTLRIHVEEIDELIKIFVSKMGFAVKMDYAEAAKYAMDAIAWGILVGRVDISPDQIPKEEQIVTSRLKMLKAYNTCIDAAQELDISQLTHKKTSAEYADTRKRLRNIKDKIHEDEDLYQELMEEKDIYGPESSGSRPDLKAINQLMIDQNSVHAEFRALRDQLDVLEKKISTIRSDLEKAKISMLEMSNRFNEDLPEELKKLSEEVISVIAKNAENLDRILDADAALTAALTSYTDSPTVKNANVAAYRHELEMMEQERKQKADKMKREAEKLKNDAKKNDNRRIITN